MNKIGADDFIVKTGAKTKDIEALPRTDISPPIIHLVDIEKTEYVGRLVQTDIVIAGVGETFHVPRKWKTTCEEEECPCKGSVFDLKNGKELLNLCRMSDGQVKGSMRGLAGCTHRGRVEIIEYETITEILALPVASAEVHGPPRDYREKVIALIGSLPTSNIRYRVTGEVIAEPKRQRASLLISRFTQLQTAADRFILTSEGIKAFSVFQPGISASMNLESQNASVKAHLNRILGDLTNHITKIYGNHRQLVLLGLLITYHSPAEIPWDGKTIKGVVDGLVLGDTGQGKTSQGRRIIESIGLGHLASGSTASRAGILYHLDSKVNDKRILRWGAFPLVHGEILFLDEAQNIRREEWREFTTARSEGILRVDRSIRAEHPSRVRLICFANPLNQRSMSSFQYGIMAVHPEFGFLDPQDLRRFDFVAVVAEGDSKTQDIFSTKPAPQEKIVRPEVLRDSILWAWTRRPDQLIYAPGAMQMIIETARSLNQKYGTPEIPLLITDAPEKVARLTFGLAALLHSTDDAHERVIATPVHVKLVEQFLDQLYSHANCAFDQYAKVLWQRGNLSNEEYEVIAEELLSPGSNREDVVATEMMLDLFLTEDCVPKPDIEAATGLGRDAVSSRIGTLRRFRLIQSGKLGYRKTSRFVAFLRRWSETKSNPSKPSNPTDPGPDGGVSRKTGSEQDTPPAGSHHDGLEDLGGLEGWMKNRDTPPSSLPVDGFDGLDGFGQDSHRDTPLTPSDDNGLDGLESSSDTVRQPLSNQPVQSILSPGHSAEDDDEIVEGVIV